MENSVWREYLLKPCCVLAFKNNRYSWLPKLHLFWIPFTDQTSNQIWLSDCSYSIILSIDGVASIYLFYFINISGSARSRKFTVSGSFLPLYYWAFFHHLNKSFHCCIAGTAGIEPRPPAQQASALSITPLPLGLGKIIMRVLSLKSISWSIKTSIKKLCLPDGEFHWGSQILKSKWIWSNDPGWILLQKILTGSSLPWKWKK